jgi:hypothetical protein
MDARVLIIGLSALLLCAAPAGAGPEEAKESASRRPAQIQWFGNWKQAQAEAKRTGRPILLTSAAPQCAGVPGMW